MLRIQSLNEFKNVFPIGLAQTSIDIIRDTIKAVETDGLKSILQYTVKRSITNKVFETE